MTAIAIATVALLGWSQESEAKTLRDITGIEREQAREGRASPLPWVVGCGAIGLALTGAWLLRRKYRRHWRLPADVWAKHELSRIAALDLAAKGKADRHFHLVSNVVRGYIEKRFQVPARKQTTAEFLNAVVNDSRISAEQLRSFLSACDLGKFAGVQGSRQECDDVTQQALAFIEAASRHS